MSGNASTSPQQLYRMAEAMRLLAISRRKLYALIDEGAIRVTRLGPRCPRIASGDLQEFVRLAREKGGGRS